MHVFDFMEDKTYARIANWGLRRIFAGKDFATWLMSRQLLTHTSELEAKSGDVIFYFRDSSFTHAGLVSLQGRVTSKWGTGQLYDHDLFEIPESYGLEVRYFKRLDHDLAIGHFTQFATEQRNAAR
jgi:hypothetical protein